MASFVAVTRASRNESNRVERESGKNKVRRFRRAAVLATVLPYFFLFPQFMLASRYHFFSEERGEDREYRNKVAGTRVKQFVHSQGSKIEADQRSVTTPQIEFYSQEQFNSQRVCPVGTNRIRSLFRRVSLSFRFPFVPAECSVYLVSRFICYAKRDISTSRNSRNIDARTDLEVPSFTVHRFPLKRWL